MKERCSSSEGYFEDSIPLLSEHKQHLAFIAKTVCIGGPAWGWCDHYESFELDIFFQMKANPLTRWDHIISQSGEFRLLRFKSLAILVCTSLKALHLSEWFNDRIVRTRPVACPVPSKSRLHSAGHTYFIFLSIEHIFWANCLSTSNERPTYLGQIWALLLPTLKLKCKKNPP